MRIDDQRRIYYEVINNQTDDVVMEIPPEQMRKFAEGLAESVKKQPAAHNIDVKSLATWGGECGRFGGGAWLAAWLTRGGSARRGGLVYCAALGIMPQRKPQA